MKIICDTCGAKYSIADEKVQGKVFKIRCKKCSEIIVVRGTADQAGSGEVASMASQDFSRADVGAASAVWHVVLEGEQQGPYTAEQVGQFVAAGQLDYESYCWRDGFGDWMHLRDVTELMAALGGAPSSPPGAAYQDQLPTVAGGGGVDPYAGTYSDPYGADATSQQQPSYGGGEAGPFDGADTVLASQQGGFTAPASAAPAAATAQEAVADLFGSGAAQAGYAPSPTPAPAAAAPAAGLGFAAPSASAEAARGAAGPGTDLFARGDEAAGMFPSDGAEDVMTSSPRVDVGRMTGTRNENSVLFSLSNLQALAASGGQAPPPGLAAASPRPMPAMGATTATTEGSGLIDIRAMAAAAVDGGDGAGGSVDDLLSIGGGGGFAPTLGAPVLMAQPPERSSKLVYAVVAVGALVVIAAAVVVVVLLTRPEPTPDNVVAAAGDQQVLAPQLAGQPGVGLGPTGEVPSAAAPPAAAATDVGSPSSPEPEGGEGSPAEASGGGGESRRGAGGGGHARRGESEPSGGVGGGSPASAAPAAPAPAAGGSPSRGGRELDDLLAGAIGPGGPAPAKAATPPPAAAGGGSGLPAKLSRAQVQAGMRTVAGAVARCGRGESGRVTVNVVIDGSSGRVSSAEVTGQFAGSAVGSCAARAVRGARFPRFSDSSLSVRGYPFVLQ